MFSRFAEQNAKLSDGSGVPFAQIKDQVREILSYQARKEDRIKKRRTEAKKSGMSAAVQHKENHLFLRRFIYAF